jgi:hypothetical protein
MRARRISLRCCTPVSRCRSDWRRDPDSAEGLSCRDPIDARHGETLAKSYSAIGHEIAR